jgi:hypothetical protein
MDMFMSHVYFQGLDLLSLVRPPGKLFTWNPRALRKAEHAKCFPRLLRKMSERRQNNKKPLQKHTRKVTKLRQSEV